MVFMTDPPLDFYREPFTVDPQDLDDLAEMIEAMSGPALTDLGRDELDQPVFHADEVMDLLTKGCKIDIETVEIMGTKNLTLVHLETTMTFPARRKDGGYAFETWTGSISGEARKHPDDKDSATIGVLAAFEDAIGRIHRDITRRLEGELKHAQDMREDGKRRRSTKAPKVGGHAKKVARKDFPAHLLEGRRNGK